MVSIVFCLIWLNGVLRVWLVSIVVMVIEEEMIVCVRNSGVVFSVMRCSMKLSRYSLMVVR